MPHEKEKKRTAHLHWACNVTPCCFCRPAIVLNLDKLRATPETLAALFGVEEPATVQVFRRGHKDKPLALLLNGNSDDNKDDCYWPLEEDEHYQITTKSDYRGKNSNNDGDAVVVIPIKHIFAMLPGDTEEAKSARLQALSNHFYDTIWNDATNVPAEFRAKFVSVTSTARIQAFRQYDWLYEVFGGPAFANESPREDHLISKVMAKHTASRMTLTHSITWLQLMAKSVANVLSDCPELHHSLGLYWLHFYAFFPYTESERRELRRVVFGKQHQG